MAWHWTGRKLLSQSTVVYISDLKVSRHQNSLQWRHNGRDCVSNHQPHECLLSRLFRRRSQKTPKLRVTGLCAESWPVTGEFPAQMASNAENASIWWRHHVLGIVIAADCTFPALNVLYSRRIIGCHYFHSHCDFDRLTKDVLSLCKSSMGHFMRWFVDGG